MWKIFESYINVLTYLRVYVTALELMQYRVPSITSILLTTIFVSQYQRVISAFVIL